MKIFLDSANIEEITAVNKLGIIDGITTNPSSISKNTKKLKFLIKEICDIVKGDVSIEAVSEEFEGMIKEGMEFAEINPQVVVKLPSTWDGIKACSYFARNSVKVNMTLCFSVSQALIAAKAGAKYISPFIGRSNDVGICGMSLVSDIKEMYANHHSFATEIIAASVRSQKEIEECAVLGVDIVTASAKLITNLIEHPLTAKGIEIFKQDWENYKK